MFESLLIWRFFFLLLLFVVAQKHVMYTFVFLVALGERSSLPLGLLCSQWTRAGRGGGDGGRRTGEPSSKTFYYQDWQCGSAPVAIQSTAIHAGQTRYNCRARGNYPKTGCRHGSDKTSKNTNMGLNTVQEIKTHTHS